MRQSIYAKTLLSLALMSVAALAQAVDINVNGEGKAAIGNDLGVTRQASLQAAKRDAVLAAVKKINGVDAGSDPKVLAVLGDITKQVGDEYIVSQSASKDASNYLVTTVKLKLDDKEFRKLISDQGIAIKTANSYPILVVMDEFFTTATDNQKPLSEVVEFFSDQSARLRVSDKERESASSASSSYARSSASLAASRDSGAIYAGRGGVAAGYDSAAVSAHAKSRSGSAESAKSSSASDFALDAQQNDVTSYKKVVQYQPQNVGPSRQSFTYEAIMRDAASYDLTILDNALFRSKYMGNKPLTLDQLTNGPELAKYVAAAHDSIKADYFMAGTTIIYDLGKNASTGQAICNGVITLKAYATTDGKLITSDARTESATGQSSDQCRVNVANKLAGFTASVLGSTIGDYWKNRNMYGQQYTVQLISNVGQLNFQTKRNFTTIISNLKGVATTPVKRGDDAKQVEYSVQYSGSTPIGDAIGDGVSTSDAFKAYPNFDVNTNGTQVRVCLESACSSKLN
jgi:hypothetical protein